MLGWAGDDKATRTAVVVGLAICLWAGGLLAEWLTALVFFTICMIAKVAPPHQVFAGFASSATWLVISGVIIGGSIRHTGLGGWLAGILAPRIGGHFPRAALMLMGFGLALSFAMPSAMGRVVLLAPILHALIEKLGYDRSQRGWTGLMLAGLMGTFLPALTILPANVPNNVFAGTMEAVLGHPPSYGQYLILSFPVLGLLKTLLLWPLLIRFYGGDDPANPPHVTPPRPLSRPERHLSLILLGAMILWMTDGWHGISPAWVGMAAGLICLFPGTGLLPDRPLQGMGFEAVFYVAGIVGMGVVADAGGLGTHLAHWALQILPLSPQNPAMTFAALSGLSALLGLVVTQPGIPAVMMPLAPSMAQAAQWPVELVAMTQVVGYSTVFLPYQAAPLVVAIQTGGIGAGHLIRLCLISALVTAAILWPLDYLWWQILGVFS